MYNNFNINLIFFMNLITTSTLNKSEEEKILLKRMQDLTSWWVSSYPDFLKKAWNNIKRQELLQKLKDFKEKLEEDNTWLEDADPICYMKRLYYLKWFSIWDVFTKLNERWLIYWSPAAVQTLFTRSFGWQLIWKDNPTKKLRDLRKQWWNKEKMEAHNQNLLEWNIKKFNDSLSNILEKKDWTCKKEFSRREYESFTGRISEVHNKAFYLLECYNNITFDDIIQASIDSWIWFRTIVRVINTKVKALQVMKSIDEDLTIKATTLWMRLNRWKKKKLANNPTHN